MSCNDNFLKSTMFKLEATESENDHLTKQQIFVKKALAKLTNDLCEQENEEKPTHHKMQSQSASSGTSESLP